MSEDDRMDRAKRIRQMREGKRVGDDPDEATADTDGGEGPPEETEAADDAAGPAEDPGKEPPDADSGQPEDPGGAEDPAAATGESPDAETATTDGGAASGTSRGSSDAAEGDGESETDDGSTPDPEVTDAVGSDSGTTTAAVPSAEEMASALEEDPAPAGDQDDSEAAQAVAEASSAREAAADTDASGTEAATGSTPEDATADTPDKAGPAGVAAAAATADDATRVLEFTLGDEQYCLDIEYIEEIVKQETITRVPNTPDFVEGVVDLRGQITTILNPKVTIGKENQAAGELIVVFDSDAFEDQGYIGWIVDDVRQVSPVTEAQVNDPPMGDDYINGVIDREDDDQFVIWTTPDLALEESA